jgi:hypothetical protein
MSIGTLEDIILKARKLSSTGSDLSLTQSQVIDYINSFYLYDLPANMRCLKLQDKYTFNTIRGIDCYPFDSEHYTTVQMPCYCAKREIKLFQDPWSFYGVNFNWQYQVNFATGDGTEGPYTVSELSAVPIIRSVNNSPMVKSPQNPTAPYYPTPTRPNFSNSMIPGRVQNILITTTSALGNTQNVTDDGNGNLIGDGIGTIDYESGAISITFNSVVVDGADIQIQYNPMVNQMAIPQSILYFQNQFTLRPVPDKGYTIEMVAYRQPSQALLGSTDPDAPNLAGVPELTEWWELLAVGAAKKIYEDKLDTDGMMIMDKMLQERYEVAETRTYAQLGKQSMSTLFRDQLSHNYGASGWGAGAGGSI